MASTNKTPHLGLCQWEATDPFLREDMNGDFARIDSAFGNLPRVKLFDVTVNQAVPSIQLDFTGIDISPYAELELFLKFSSEEKSMRMNGKAGSSDYLYRTPSSSYSANKAAVKSGSNWLSIGPSEYVHYISGDFITSKMSRSTFYGLYTLEFICNDSTKKFSAGDRITVWGVRR